MNILNNHRMITRIRGYPDRLASIQQKFGCAVNDVSIFVVNPDGNIMNEIANFQEKLRAYTFALETCKSYTEAFLSDIDVDILTIRSKIVANRSLNADPFEVGGKNIPDSTVLTLETEKAIAQKMLAECSERIEYVRTVRRTLQAIEDEQTLARLVQLEKELATNIKLRG
ncbi:hypothetical protein IJG90_02670 [Candidatus Saccharibacteria bacterium]|nr:hypothetical protein [Candidatus Saccharibacteria bacterium]